MGGHVGQLWCRRSPLVDDGDRRLELRCSAVTVPAEATVRPQKVITLVDVSSQSRTAGRADRPRGHVGALWARAGCGRTPTWAELDRVAGPATAAAQCCGGSARRGRCPPPSTGNQRERKGWTTCNFGVEVGGVGDAVGNSMFQ